MQTNPQLRLSNKMLGVMVVLLIAASWGGNVWYYFSAQLEKPVFLKHYIALNGNISDRIELRYLENKMKGKKVRGIQIEELPMLQFQINPHPTSYRHQVLGTAYGEWRAEYIEHMEKVPLTIREATVYYSEGQPEKVPIGEIIVSWDEREDLLEMQSSKGSSDGSGQYSVIVKEPLILKEIAYSFHDQQSPIFELGVAVGSKSMTQLPLSLAAGDSLTFSYKWVITGDSPAVYEVYDSDILLTFETKDGRTVHDWIPVNFNHYPNEQQIKRLVRSGGELY